MPEITSTLAQYAGNAFILALAITPILAAVAAYTHHSETVRGTSHDTSDTIGDIAYTMIYVIFASGVMAVILHNIAIMMGCAF